MTKIMKSAAGRVMRLDRGKLGGRYVWWTC
jgi:hypothetical protein